MRLAVSGSRHWTDRAMLFRVLDDVRPRPTLLIHGGADGADRLAETWAKARKIAIAIVRPADPSRRADYIERNKYIVDMADFVVVFRAIGKSNGTDFTIEYAQRAGKLMEVAGPVYESREE